MRYRFLYILLVFISSNLLLENLFSLQAQTVKIASVQYPIEGDQSKESFFKKIDSMVKKASEEGAQLVLFPEWVSLDLWPLKSKKSEKEIIQSIANEVSRDYWSHLKKLSKQYGLIIIGGTTAQSQGSKIFNSASVVFPDGRLLIQQKNYLTKWEKDNGLSAGKSGLQIVEMPWGRVAIAICYDVEFPNLSTRLAKSEFDVLLVPSMTESLEGVKRVLWTAQARAVEHTSYVVISPTQGSTTKSWKHFGRATFLSPQLPGFSGVLAEGDQAKAGVVVHELDLGKLRKAKAESSWRPSKQLRLK